jgi:hypothetical protein
MRLGWYDQRRLVPQSLGAGRTDCGWVVPTGTDVPNEDEATPARVR